MQNPELISPVWSDYELIDSGGYEKLERWGRWITRRPEPQAIWKKSLDENQWLVRADAVFKRGKGGEDSGVWQLRKGMPEQWTVAYDFLGMHTKMRLGLTSFKHVGLFPEQADNWNYIYKAVEKQKETISPKVLNLFAYTGGASLAACAAGAEVTHVDSVKPVVTWARENMELSGLDGIHWVVEDALKFVRREVKRGKRYNGIILDPPAYGRGPEGEKWVLEQNIGELLECCSALLDPDNGFLVINLYSMGLSSVIAKSAVGQLFEKPKSEQFGELCFTDSFGKTLPLGVYYRCSYINR